jgi:uncharacterized membrane protein
MGLVVVALGLWLVTQGARRQGLLAVAAGVCAFALVNGIVMPSLNGGAASATDHRLYGDLGSGPAQIAGHVLSHPVDTLRLLTHPAEKLRLLLLTFGGFLFLTLLSPLAIVAVPQLLERLLTTDPHYWAPEFHYTLVLAPVLAIGAADGLARIGRIGRRSAIGPAAVAALPICVLLFSAGSAATGPPARLTHTSFYAHTGADRARDDAVKTIPAGAPVAAGAYLLPHLSDRARVYLPTRAGIARSDWLIYASTSPARIAGWKLVFGRDGIVVYKRALR